MLGPGELVVSGGEVAAGPPPAADPDAVESLFGDLVPVIGVLDLVVGDGELVALVAGGLQLVADSAGGVACSSR